MRVLGWSIAAGAAAALLACSSADEMGQEIADNADPSMTEIERRLATDASPVEFRDDQTEGEASREFAYSWPAQVSAIAPLAAMLREARDTQLAKQKAEWSQSVAEFADAEDGFQCITCVNRSYSKSWAVSADTPRLLVVTAETYAYTGGAHGNSFFDVMAWDRQANDGNGAALRPVEMFVDPVALENTAYGEYCEALRVAKVEKLGAEYAPTNPFDGCPSVTELVVVPVSSTGKTFDTIRFLAAPYVAGAYAEGPYEFAIPMTRALLDIVKPEYRSAFSLGE